MWKRILSLIFSCAIIFIVLIESRLGINLGIPTRLAIALPFAIASGLLTIWADNE